jgi:ABC-type polysaccharide/polyol phosphate transport system ATPase subunit
MSPDGTIDATHIWKRFRGDRNRRQRNLPDQLRKLGSRVVGRGRDYRWALEDVDLVVQPGEAVGLVGANGSGKSTLLKILTRVMYPYAGRLDVRGRVGALIEVRAGIHPELTGRENIELYGILLGLSRRDVARRFDDIVAFAELEDAIDRQVKFYSSGMQMRIGFAVAAFLEPDILLVDEVLAVGDAAFQQKCLNRMREVIEQGTTLVFVSHDLAVVESTCTRGVWLDKGTVASDGPVRDVLGSYRRAVESDAEQLPTVHGLVRVVKAQVRGGDGYTCRTQGPLDLTLVVETDDPRPEVRIFIGVSEGTATPIFMLRRDASLDAGETEIRCLIDPLPLPRGRYYLWVGAFARARDLLPWHPASQFEVTGPDLDATPRGIVRLAPVHVESEWSVERR